MDSRNHRQTNERSYAFSLQIHFNKYREYHFFINIQLTTALTIAVRSAHMVPPTSDQLNESNKFSTTSSQSKRTETN